MPVLSKIFGNTGSLFGKLIKTAIKSFTT